MLHETLSQTWAGILVELQRLHNNAHYMIVGSSPLEIDSASINAILSIGA